MRLSYKYPIKSIDIFVRRFLKSNKDKEYVSILLSNSNNLSSSRLPREYINYDLIAGVEKLDSIELTKNSFDGLQQFHDQNRDWMFGYLSYDLKNEVEKLDSLNTDEMKVHNLEFFIPKYVFLLKGNILEVLTYESKINVDYLIENLSSCRDSYHQSISLHARESKDKYLQKINKIKKHIQQGDIYEMNYCVEYFAHNVHIDPENLFSKLNSLTRTPFSGFMHIKDNYLLCASPERFLRKTYDQVISQPIKGTIKRGKNNKEDQELIKNLKLSSKDISENIMITDLVRNDLSITANDESVYVDELCKVYTFRSIHQMITTISSKIDKRIMFSDLLKSTFPMGSMTGAPKLRAMKLIEKYEEFKRGIFSGSIGYITPLGDFDFNVVIRSILYNRKSKYLSVGVGGAITINSDPQKEYDECLVKIQPILELLNTSIHDR